MSVEHRKQIEQVLYRVIHRSMDRAQKAGRSRDHQLVYTIGYLTGLISQVAADDSQLEMQLYKLIRRLEE